MPTTETPSMPFVGFGPINRKKATVFMLGKIREAFVTVDILQRQEAYMSDELADRPRLRSGKHTIYLYPLAHVSNEIQLVVLRLENMPRDSTVFGLYHDRTGMYNPYTDEDLYERLTTGLEEGETMLGKILVQANSKRELMVTTGRVGP